MDSDYDSSDLEFDAPAPNKFAGVGLKSIEIIKKDAKQDRITSKQFTVQLQFTEASKHQEYMAWLWYNRFKAFREHALRIKNPLSTPEPEEIERFLVSIVSKVKPKTLAVPSYNWLRIGLERLEKILRFHYRQFDLTKNDRIRFDSIFQQLLSRGQLTKEASREKQWVGVVLVRRLLSTIMREALEDGTPTWDKTIMKANTILLISSLECRCGDIMISPHDAHDLPFLCYKDIVIKLRGGEGIDNLVAVVTIRNEKGKKDDPLHNRKVVLRALTTADDNFMCPVKMVLVMALRLGAVGYHTIDELLASVAARADRTLQWKEDWNFRPVLTAFDPSDDHCLVDKPAGVRQAWFTLAVVGSSAGLMKPICPHDLRRGGARDVAHLPPDSTGLATAEVADSLGHSLSSLHDGTTGKYVGPSTVDRWSKRVYSKYDDPHEMEVAEQAYKRPHLDAVTWKSLYQKAGLDVGDYKATRIFRDSYYADHQKSWRDSQSHRRGSGMESALRTRTPSEVNSGASLKASTSSLGTSRNPIVLEESNAKGAPLSKLSTTKLHMNSTYTSNNQPKVSMSSRKTKKISIDAGELETIGAPVPKLLGAMLGDFSPDNSSLPTQFQISTGPVVPKEAFVDEDSMTPAQLSNAENIGDVLGNQDGIEPDQAAATALFDELENPIEAPGFCTMPPIDFVTHLSQINVVRNQTFGKSKGKAIPDSFRGNSRSEPVLFQYNCTKTPGCKYFAHAIWTMHIHEGRCNAELVETTAADKQFACDVEDCVSSFTNEDALKNHLAREHNWAAKPCPKKGCNPTYLFQNINEWKRHRDTVHSPWTPKTCPIDECTFEGEFTRAQSLKTHLQTIHKITDPSILKEHTYIRNPPYVPQSCNMPGCGHPNVYSSKKQLKKHYRKAHGLDLDEANEYISLI